ncbi:PPIC-type PPIASE domain protein [Sulfitobacter noctilucae]|uniref:peptidylprolyl isomerase n=1 Tax=Sulfitobacter noctilucae TaxID=1342302 RepID=UPI00046A175D|nr:peptidylprolyl isomerase [Sulfitobacter noctilucae]KIN65695.1 PPIC-type PPIASE domain protein [Sulfitobacter noctilucae]
MQKPLTFLASIALAATLTLPATAQDEPGIDTVVATVNGTDITLGHMIIARATLPEQYQQLPDEVLFTGILDQLVQQSALADTFDGELPDRVTLSLQNEERSLTAGEVIEQVMAADVDEAEIKAAYEETYANQEAGDEYNASHILVETEEEAAALKVQLDEGADFAELAREKSTGPSGPSGGSLGWFGPGMMVPSFEEAVAAMEAGAVSDPVQTQFGWHVIKLNETRKTEAPELDAVREELEMQLRQTRVQARIEEITAEADVDRSASEGIDPTLIKNLDWLE